MQTNSLLLNRILLIAFLGILLYKISNGQDSIRAISIQEVVISENPFDYTIAGITIEKMDTISKARYVTESVGSFLSSSTPIFIKSYGSAATSTIAFRGTSAGHTGIFWNGIPLNSVTLGLSNLSLLPITFFQNINIQHGGASSLLGSGNIGGSIHLQNQPQFIKESNLNYLQEIGSFGQYSSIAQLKLAKEKWYTSSMLQFFQLKNDFTFINTSDVDKPLQIQTNADKMQYGIMQSVYYKIQENQYIGTDLWYQKTASGVPTLMTASQSAARQYDESFKANIVWNKHTAFSTYHLQAAYSNEYSLYTDSSIGLESNIYSQLYFTKAEASFHFSNANILSLGSNTIYAMAKVPYYTTTTTTIRAQIAGYASFMHYFERLHCKSSFTLRQEIIPNYKFPFSPSLGIDGKLWSFVYFQASVSKNFKIPSFNDLYWTPGGNPELLPETGWNEEGGLLLKWNIQNKCKAETSFIYYNSVIDNWILWLPVNGSNYWQAQNAKKVWARGIEILSKNAFQIFKIKCELNGGYTFSKSTNIEVANENDQSKGKQLLYVPKHNANAEIRIHYQSNFLSYTQSYTGLRYTTSDNVNSIPSYALGNLAIGTNYQRKKISLSLQFKINNIWNIAYQSIEWMAMPGRNYQLSLKINFHSFTNKS